MYMYRAQQEDDGFEARLSSCPEQIAGRRCRETGQRLSAETIYQYIARDKRSGGTLYRQLRYQGKPYRKKYGRTDYRGRIPGRVDIDQRPAIVAARTRLGDWEADLVMGKTVMTGCALTLEIIIAAVQIATKGISLRFSALWKFHDFLTLKWFTHFLQ